MPKTAIVFHPYAREFRMLEGEAFDSLVNSIKENGQERPIIVRKSDGMGVDGRNRLKACEFLGVEPLIEERDLTEEQTIKLIRALNLDHRHLTTSERTAHAASYSKYLQESRDSEAAKSDTSHESNGSSELKLDLAKTQKKKGGRPKTTGDADEEAAKSFGVSKAIIKAYRMVEEKCPDLAKMVKDGILTINAAVKQMKARTKPAKTKSTGKKSKTKSPPKKNPDPYELDLHSVPIPDYLKRFFDVNAKFDELEEHLSESEKLIDEIALSPVGHRMQKWLQMKGKKWMSLELHNARGTAKDYRPYTICPYCETATAGRANAQCKKCNGEGWTDKSRFGSAPEDYRKNVDKLKVTK